MRSRPSAQRSRPRAGARSCSPLQAADGYWAGGAYKPDWTATTATLQLLRQFGIDPASDQVRRAVALVRDNVLWEYDDLPYFDGEVEPCINGQAVAVGAYFGEDVRGIVDRLLAEQMADGGWNCEQENGSHRGSFDTTINVLEGLLEYERAVGGDATWLPPACAGRSTCSSGACFVACRPARSATAWLYLAFPHGWHYNVLRALDHMRDAGVTPDERMAEPIQLLESKRDAEAGGRWSWPSTTSCPSTWASGWTSQADGTRSAPCACSAGPSRRLPGNG